MMAQILELWPAMVVIGGLIGTWYVVQYKVKDLREDQDKINKTDQQQWQRLDDQHTRISLLENRIRVISDIIQPDKLAEFHKSQAAFQTGTEKDIAYLRRDVDTHGDIIDQLRKKGGL